MKRAGKNARFDIFNKNGRLSRGETQKASGSCSAGSGDGLRLTRTGADCLLSGHVGMLVGGQSGFGRCKISTAPSAAHQKQLFALLHNGFH